MTRPPVSIAWGRTDLLCKELCWGWYPQPMAEIDIRRRPPSQGPVVTTHALQKQERPGSRVHP